MINYHRGQGGMRIVKIIYLTHAIYKDDDLYTAICPELDIASCGESIEEADKSLTEAILT